MNELERTIAWLENSRAGNKTVKAAIAKIRQLQAVEAATREYRSVTSYNPASDGSCSQCDALGGDLEEHSFWCAYRKATEALDKALDGAA